MVRSARICLVVSGIASVVVVLLQVTVFSQRSVAEGGVLSEDEQQVRVHVDQTGFTTVSCSEILGSVISDSLLASRCLVLETPSDSMIFSLAELAAFPFCVEGPGGFTTSAGSSVTGNWAGVSLPDLLTQWAGLEGGHAVTFVADDGYRMTFEGPEILDRTEGTWILALLRDGASISADEGLVRAVKVGPGAPMVTGHVAVQWVSRIKVTGRAPHAASLTIRGRRHVEVDRQTLQSCVSCHGATVPVDTGESVFVYQGVPLYRMLAFSDDSIYAPHQQDSAILAYQAGLAQGGYAVEVADVEGKTLSLDSRNLNQNEAVILAFYRDGQPLTEGQAPLVLVVGAGEKGEESPAYPAVFPRITSVTLHLP
jgi:hypothetical protein